MSEVKKVDELNIDAFVPESESSPKLDPFTPENLCLPQNFDELLPVTKPLTVVPVRKPSPQDWFRVHPDPEYRQNVCMIFLRDDREFYVLGRDIASQLADEAVRFTLYVTLNRQGTVALWPVRLPDINGRDMDWWASARDAAARGTERWVRIRADQNLGAYQLYLTDAPLPDPEWPQYSFWDLVKIAFSKRLINTLDHPVVLRLRSGQ
jgi:hypothetical protein